MTDDYDTLVHVEEFLKDIPGNSIVEKAMNVRDTILEQKIEIAGLLDAASRNLKTNEQNLNALAIAIDAERAATKRESDDLHKQIAELREALALNDSHKID
jgi:hypothetical protein